MTSYKSHFGGNTLKAEDLQGKDHPVTIEQVYEHTFEGRDGKPNETKLVARFTGKAKILVLNLTNADSIAAVAGSDDFEHWQGVNIILYPTTTRFGADMVPCIRVKAGAPAAAPSPALSVDDIPF